MDKAQIRKAFESVVKTEDTESFEDPILLRLTGLSLKQIMELKERDTAMEINEIHVDEYYCPACGSENNCDQGVVWDNFCPRCGQRIKVRED